MNDLEIEIANLEKEIERKKEELRLQAEPLIITYSDMGKVYLDLKIKLNKFDSRIVDILRWIPSRVYYNQDESNKILVRDLNLFRSRIPDGVIQKFDPPELEAELIKLTSAADFYVTLTSKKDKIKIQAGPLNKFGLILYGLDSFTRDISNKFYTLDVNELWRFLTIVKEQSENRQFEYDEEVLNLVNKQLEKRDELKKLNEADDFNIEVPLINGDKFYGFQKAALEFARITDYNCILALDMGLGKTPISIALAEITKSRVLFVVPATLKTNTLREIKKWTGKDALVLSGASPTNADIDSLIINKSQYNIINYDVIGREVKSDDPSIPGIMKWVQILNAAKFDMIIGDELHYIKNADSQRSRGMKLLKAPKKIGLTGTPIVNRPGELFPALSWIAPDKFQSDTKFQSAYMDSKGNAKDVKRLREVLQEFMFRKKKEDVIKDLPPITRINHFVPISDKANKHYQEALAGLYIALRNPNYKREINSILAQLTRLKQIISDDKVEATIELAMNALVETDEKVLIFSQFVDTCRAIAAGLPSALCITGDATDDERYQRIDKFQNDDSIKFMVLSTKAGAEGITLTKAHTVIFNDLCWTPKDHRQAEARCYGRMSDMHGAVAYYVQTENTIDEMIGELLAKKLQIIEEIVDNVNTGQGEAEGIVSELIENLKKGLK